MAAEAAGGSTRSGYGKDVDMEEEQRLKIEKLVELLKLWKAKDEGSEDNKTKADDCSEDEVSGRAPCACSLAVA